MIEHIWSVLCSRGIIDRDSNNVSLFEVLEQLNVSAPPPVTEESEIPFLIISCELVTLWARSNPAEPARGRARVRISAPSGKTYPVADYDIDLSSYLRYRARNRIGTLPIPEGGFYRIRVQVQDEDQEQWRDVASVPLQVVVQASAQA